MDADANALINAKHPAAALTNQVRRFCKKYYLFQAGVVVIAVSGGADSLVMLHVLHDLRAEFRITLHVATLDHGLRGADGAADADFVRLIADHLEIPVTVGKADVTALAGLERLGIETAARKARYQFLTDVAQTVGSTQIAVAHHLNDQAETVLMHLFRGSGLAGLRGMLPVTLIQDRFRLLRPLLDSSRTKIDAYLLANGLTPRVDITNTDPNFARNRIRLEILPVLRTLNPALDTALSHTAEIARADYEALQWTLRAQLPDWPASATRAVFQKLPRGLQRLAVHQLVLEWRFEQVEALIDMLLMATAGDSITLPAGAVLLVTFDKFVYSTTPDQSLLAPGAGVPLLKRLSRRDILLPGSIDLPNGWQLVASHWPMTDDRSVPDWSDPLITTLSLPPDAAIILRTRQAGDRFTPQGLAGHQQKLSDTFVDLKVPVAWRDQLPLLTVNGQIAWIVAPTAKGLIGRVAEPFAWRRTADTHNNWRFAFRQITP